MNESNRFYKQGRKLTQKYDLGDLGNWDSDYLIDLQILEIADNFKISPKEIEEEWEFRDYQKAISFLKRKSDMALAQEGMKDLHLEKQKKERR